MIIIPMGRINFHAITVERYCLLSFVWDATLARSILRKSFLSAEFASVNLRRNNTWQSTWIPTRIGTRTNAPSRVVTGLLSRDPIFRFIWRERITSPWENGHRLKMSEGASLLKRWINHQVQEIFRNHGIGIENS